MKSVFLLVLACTAFATSETEYIQLIHRIDATPFGRTLFDTIWLQLETGDPLDRLLNTLSDLEDRYQQEQREDDAENREFQDSCNVDIAAYDKDIANTDSERISLEARLEGDLYPRRAIISGLVTAKKAEVKGYQKEIDDLDAERAAQHADFEEIAADHNTAIAVLTEARNIIKANVEATSSLVQKKQTQQAKEMPKEHISLLQKHIKESQKKLAHTKHMLRYVPVLKLLSQITSKAKFDDSTIQKVVDLFDRLINEVSDSLSLQRFAEDKRVEAYNKTRKFLVIALTVAGSELANAESDFASVSDIIRQVEASLENTNQRLELLNERRTDRWTQCEEAAKDYADARSARDADRQVVSDTIGLVNKSLRTLREQLALRQAAGDNI
ncbi:unnamed protein product (macronuclear) [Paramecium tetraurelia]|uniref:Trichocyst matrix protein n=1 Tax=Paramecium tetraurelia TaxID=5888 RepID=A0C468_PARTE|nr:uncharacterized protein GSPATT00035065001 [Paramecium tetraurelia]CAK65585.1 unnamed protein product [Paramecium tetraurelia]|eukprot:XP_001432982.1 hypothetical protein (macronuclear) [Paramecium tetraurelia strain d4-2]